MAASLSSTLQEKLCKYLSNNWSNFNIKGAIWDILIIKCFFLMSIYEAFELYGHQPAI